MSSGPVPVKRPPRNVAPALLCTALLLGVPCPPAPGGLAGLPASSAPREARGRVSPRLDFGSFGDTASRDAAFARIAWWQFFKPHHPPIYESQPHNVTPHPAVARIVVTESGAMAFGSGTLVDVRDQYGLVVTNWHVVQDARGPVEVSFPGGFRSHARPLKVDSNWDLAALVIWRPPIEPVKLAKQPPRPGDLLTIHGYGRGQYRIATGRCTTYYAPRLNYPLEMVELDVEARQGDSGGPIFNQTGELAGVLFGAGQGTTLGSYAPRVSNFLATLAPDIGQAQDQALVAVADRPAPNVEQPTNGGRHTPINYPSSPWSPPDAFAKGNSAHQFQASQGQRVTAAADSATTANDATGENDPAAGDWYESLKSALAIVGLVAIAAQLVKVVR
jgi:hypothetical protein